MYMHFIKYFLRLLDLSFKLTLYLAFYKFEYEKVPLLPLIFGNNFVQLILVYFLKLSTQIIYFLDTMNPQLNIFMLKKVMQRDMMNLKH